MRPSYHIPPPRVQSRAENAPRGVGVRCVLQRRRDFRTAVGIRAGLWLVCEIIVDIGAMHEMSIGLFSAAAALGAMGLMFALGLLLGALVCRLLRRKQLA